MQLDDLCKIKPFVMGLMELWNDLAMHRNIEYYTEIRQARIHELTIPPFLHALLYSSNKIL